jgi:hypothetical protein
LIKTNPSSFALNLILSPGLNSPSSRRIESGLRIVEWAGTHLQSARGLVHSKTLRVRRAAPHFRQVLDCGGPPPLFPGTIAQSVFIRVHPWLKIQTPIAPIVHPKMNSGKESVANAEFGMRSVRHRRSGFREKAAI